MTATDEELAFRRDICAAPKDDTVRLVYADWLDEHDQAERAEFVRVQVEIEATRKQPGWLPGPELFHEGAGNPAALFRLNNYDRETKLDDLRRRGRELAGDRFECWTDDLDSLRPLLTAGGSVAYARGFVSHVTCTGDDWLAHADALYWHPSQTVRCEACRDVRDADRRVFGTDAGVWCKACDSTSTVPRPCPATAQPIEQVTLTTEPPITLGSITCRDWPSSLAKGVVREVAWWAGIAGRPVAQFKETVEITDEDMLSRNGTLYSRKLAHFDRRIEEARRPAATLKAWWPDITFNVKPPASL